MATSDNSAGQRAADRTVLFVHGSLSSGGMWTGARRAFEDRFAILTPDLTGYGAAPAWAGQGSFHIREEVALLEAAVADAVSVDPDAQIDIVAHSYGGMVAVRYALENPERVRSLMLFEPTVFRVLKEPGIGSADAWFEINRIARIVARGVAAGAPVSAMRHFVDYWNGKGCWRTLPEERRNLFAAQAATVARNFEAGESDEVPLNALRDLNVPAFVVAGSGSTKAALATAWAVASLLPDVEHVTLRGPGHMMPVTHMESTLRLIAGWLGEGRVLVGATPRAAA
jgi:pimeloyl-ACP methyl ester carboxylesterase